MSNTTLLALELSQARASVAVRGPDGTLRAEELGPGRDSAEECLLVADAILRDCGVGPMDLRAVAVSLGPGGFTGLRIAVAAAQMIVEATGAAAVGVPTALVCAETSLSAADDRALSLLAVRRRPHATDAWATWLRRIDGSWCIDGRPSLSDVAGIDFAGAGAILAERAHLPELAASVESAAAHGEAVRWVESRCTAAGCLTVAERRLAEGDCSADPFRLAPIYARQPEAVTIWQARHGREGAESGGREGR